jgi:hypothetical protein
MGDILARMAKTGNITQISNKKCPATHLPMDGLLCSRANWMRLLKTSGSGMLSPFWTVTASRFIRLFVPE